MQQTVEFHSRCTPSFKAELCRAAEEHGISMSDYVRMAVKDRIRRDRMQYQAEHNDRQPEGTA